jgi:tetratricopeptide (TPR) repeat protein
MGDVIDLFGKDKKKEETEQKNKKIESNGNDFIECYDGYGRKRLVPRDEWKKSVLPNQLKKHWESANELYSDIILSLNDGFEKEVLDAARHLKETDPVKERGYAILAIVYMKNNLYDNAEKTLNDYIKLYGKTGTILTNLAKVYYSQKDISKTMETLWEGLCLDPNQENGLTWWAALNYEEGGNDQYFKSLEKAADLEGSWMPQIFMARYFLEQKEYEKAKTLYEYIINSAKNEISVLYSISGDLGKNGYIKEIIELVAPLYDVNNHDTRAGLNILQAYLQTGNYVEGQKLLNKMMQLKRPDLREYLLKFSNDFEQLKKNDSKDKIMPDKVDYELAVINKPIWYYGLNSPDWLLPKDLVNENIGFFTFSQISGETVSAPAMQQEDDSGRMTRSIPLFLQEVLLFTFNISSKCIIPVAKDIGPVISNKDWNPQSLKEISQRNNLDILVTGSVSGNQEGYDVKVILFESQSQATTTYEMKLCNKGKNDEFTSSVKDIVLKIAKIRKIIALKAGNYYKMPSDDLIPNYLSALGQSLMQSLVDSQLVRFEDMWGERNILHWYLNLALAAPENPVPKILFISGLAKSKSYGSEIYKEFRDQAINLINEEKNGESPARMLLPFVYYLYGMEEEFAAIKDTQMTSGMNKS